MVDELILAELNLDSSELEREVAEAMSDPALTDLGKAVEESIRDFEPGSVVAGRVVQVVGDDVIVDVGYKSEGVVSLNEFGDRPEVKPGDQVDVLLEAVKDDS